MSNPTVPPASDPSDDQNAPDQSATARAGGDSPAEPLIAAPGQPASIEPEIEMDSLETGAE